MNAEIDKNLMRWYLLGALSEDEQDKLEAEYFADNEKFEQVWALENELVDDYVRGRLPNDERALFERNFLASPKHQARVTIARSLLLAADASIIDSEAAAPVTRSSREPWWTSMMAFLRPPQLIWGGAIAMLLLAGWWFLRSPSPEKIAIATPSPVVTKTETPLPVTPSPLPTAQPSPTVSSPQPSPSSSPAAQPAVPSVLAFVLVGAGVRDAGKGQQLALPTGTKQVRLQMQLSDAEFARYQVRLREVDGAEIFNQSSLPLSTNKKSVAAMIPATKLSPGDYVVTLSGVSQTGEAEDVNKYFLRVTRK